MIVMLVSFGFIGIEYISMALDNPLADNTNDVDEHGMAVLVYGDIYLAIYHTDGPAAAFELRERVLERYRYANKCDLYTFGILIIRLTFLYAHQRQGRGLDCYRNDLKTYGFVQ